MNNNLSNAVFLPALALSAVLAGVATGDTICFEADSAETIEAPMTVVDATNVPPEMKEKIVKGASEDKYVEIAQGKGNPPKVTAGQTTYQFDVTAEGVYYLWCRVYWDDECGNSFFLNVDDAKPFAFGEDSTMKSWHWVRAPRNLKQLNLTKGKHRLTVRNREDGVRLDQVMLTNDPKCVPVDVETVTVKKEVGSQATGLGKE